MSAGALPRPLEGVRILDLSRVFAGPVAGRTLADLGADVVKVEPPDGDVTRTWGRKVAGQSTYFVQQNAGKRNICVDLTHPDGAGLVADLAAVADIVIENFRPGVMARHGLDWESLRVRNPRLVMLSISGFGQVGPESQRAAYASIVHAEMGLIGRGVHLGGDGRQDVNFSAADVLSGLHGVIGVLAALRVRDATGVGQHVDLAMVDAMGFSDDFIAYNIDDAIPQRINGEVWETSGGPICIAGGMQWMWRQLKDAHGLEDGAAPDADVATKIRMRRARVEAFFMELPDGAAVRAALDAANLAWGMVSDGHDVFNSPTLAARGSLAHVDDRAGGKRAVFQSPYRFSAATSGVQGQASHRGEDNEEVLTDWLGASNDEAMHRAQSGAMKRDVHADQVTAGRPIGLG